MSMSESLVRFLPCGSSISMAHLMLVIPLLLPLAGCTGEGAGGPIISNLSAPMDATAGSDSDQESHLISNLSAPTDTTAGSDSDKESHSEEANHGDGEKDPIITMTSTPTGVTAHLTWDPPSGIEVAGYYVYYGKPLSEEPISEESGSEELSSEEPTSCSHGEKQAVDAPLATITDLEPNTEYFFGIHALIKNEPEGLCSNEIVTITPPAQS